MNNRLGAFTILTLAICICIIYPALAHPQAASKKMFNFLGGGISREKIKADKLVVRNKDGSAVWSGNVIVTSTGDQSGTKETPSDDTTMTCTTLEIQYESADGAENSDNIQSNVKKVIATGDVKIEGTSSVSSASKKPMPYIVTADKAVYVKADETVTLTGNPVIKNDKNVMKGTKIIYSLNDEELHIVDADAVMYRPSQEGK
jgi:lipopolysaccharide export system protein LptA